MSNSFVFYESFLKALEVANDKDQLLAYQAIAKYALYGIEPVIDKQNNAFAYAVFEMARPQIDANTARRENGKHGGRPAKPKDDDDKNHRLSDEKTIGFENEKPNVNVNVNVNANDNTSAHSMRDDAEQLFTELWTLYPRKKGKTQVSKKSKTAILKIGKDRMVAAIERFKADMERQNRPEDMYPYGSTFFNSGYTDYLDEEDSEPPPTTESRERCDYNDMDTYLMRKSEGWEVDEYGWWVPPPIRVQ